MGPPQFAKGGFQLVDASRIVGAVLSDFQSHLHLSRSRLDVTEQIELILIQRLVKPGSVRAMEALHAFRVNGLGTAQETSKDCGPIGGSSQFVSRGRHGLPGFCCRGN